jgi:TRAP-type C4-dicarboxylate transport system substrate-binding protein
MKRQAHLVMLSFLVAVAILATGCASGTAGSSDKAGGPGEPVVLRMASIYDLRDLGALPALAYFVDRVQQLSGGNVRIDVVDEWGNFASDAEQQVVRAVSSGEVELGWTGSRVFDTLGVESFGALTAPMLVDSYVLEDAVIRSGITNRMMGGLDDAGVVGLGVLAGGLRKPIGVTAPLLGPEDWRNKSFGANRSDIQVEAIRALGATPVQVIGPHRETKLEDGTIQGFEFNLYNYGRDPGMIRLAPYVTANVNLWPQMDVLMAEPERLSALTSEQRGWLQQAADDAANRSAELADTDAESISDACDSGARFADASEAELAALQESFAPVHASLQQNPDTKSYIEQIQELKQSITPEPGPAIPSGCTGKPAAQPTANEGSTPAKLDGIYRYTITKQDLIEAGDPEDPGTFTVTLEGGKFSHHGTGGGFSGTYTVENNRITFKGGDAVNTFTFSLDDDGDLHLKPVPPMDPGDAFMFSVHPWTRIG